MWIKCGVLRGCTWFLSFSGLYGDFFSFFQAKRPMAQEECDSIAISLIANSLFCLQRCRMVRHMVGHKGRHKVIPMVIARMSAKGEGLAYLRACSFEQMRV